MDVQLILDHYRSSKSRDRHISFDSKGGPLVCIVMWRRRLLADRHPLPQISHQQG